MRKFFVLFIVLTLIFSLSSYAMELEWAGEERYTSVDMGKDIGVVHSKEGSAIINKYANVVTPFTSNLKKVTPNGLVAVLGDNGYIGFFNNKGEQITDYIYDAFSDTHEKSHITQVGYLSHMHLRGSSSSSLLAVSLNGKFGYINPYGTTVIPHKYEFAYGFQGGMARICADGILSDYGTYTNGKYGFLKENGEEILPPDSYWLATDFNIEKGYASAGNGVNDSVLIDKDGIIYKTDGKGYAPVSDFVFLNEENTKHSVLDKTGNTVIPWTWCYGIEYYNNRFVYNNEIHNEKNELIYKAPEGISLFTKMSDHDSNFLYIRKPHPEIAGYALIGLIDMNGNTVIEPEYQTVLDLGEGIIYARSETENFLFDYKGNRLMRLNGQVDYNFSRNGFFVMKDFDTMELGIAVNPLYHPKVYLNGKKVKFTDAYPFLKDSRTFVPLRAVFEKLGAEVGWDDNNNTVTVKKDDKVISMTVGNKNIKVNGVDTEIDTSPVIRDDRVYIPLRAFSESLGLGVEWIESDYRVNIN